MSEKAKVHALFIPFYNKLLSIKDYGLQYPSQIDNATISVLCNEAIKFLPEIVFPYIDKSISMLEDIIKIESSIDLKMEYFDDDDEFRAAFESTHINPITEDIIDVLAEDGLRHYNNCFKSELARFIERISALKVRIKELNSFPDVELNNVSVQSSKALLIRHTLKSKELKTLFEELQKNQLISNHTEYSVFEAHFTETPPNQKIKWEGNEVDLIYLIEFLIEQGKLPPNTFIHVLIKDHFLNKNNSDFETKNLKNSKKNYLGNKKNNGKPSNAPKIEQVVIAAINPQ